MDFGNPADPVTSSVQTTVTSSVVDSGGAHTAAHVAQSNPWIIALVCVTTALIVLGMIGMAWWTFRPTSRAD